MHDYIRHLAAAHNSRNPDLAACTRWRFPTPDPAVIRTAGGTTTEEFHVNGTVAQAFAIFHAGRPRAVYGRSGDNIGVTMKSLGRNGARGVSDPGTRRMHELLLSAATWTQLNDQLVRIARALKAASAGKPWDTPDWELLHADLTRWSDPSQRDHVRLEWGQGLVSFRPALADNRQLTDSDAVNQATQAH